MKSLTLSTLPPLLEYISGWEVPECDTWPYKRSTASPKNAGTAFTPATPAALCLRQALAIAFLLTLPFCFFVWMQKSLQGLSGICVLPLTPPPCITSFFCRFCQNERKKKTAKVKSPQSTSNQRSSPFLPSSFLWTRPLFCLWLPFGS